MEEKMNQYGIVLDGKMDEPIWDSIPEYTGFHLPEFNGGGLLDDAEQTSFKILPCADRIYIGVKCKEPDMETTEETKTMLNSWGSPAVELFFSPSGSALEFYQFFVAFGEQMDSLYYGEGGQIQPDPYAPQWKRALYAGKDYWSCEVEIPLTAFYMTPHTRWSDRWLVNICRTRIYRTAVGVNWRYSTWCQTERGFIEPNSYAEMEGFPIRLVENDVCIVSATADMTKKLENGYSGAMKVKVNLAEGGTFTFTSSVADPVKMELPAGTSEFTAPCFFEDLGRPKVDLALRRESSGEVYQRWYPVLVEYEPIRLKFSLPEYRNNFYPGQDYTKIVGIAKSAKPITLTLEGAGIPKTTITPNADGSFCFDTPNFQEGEAWLTATIDGYETKKMIRRLAPTGKLMTWVSGGNLVMNGKPVLRRNFYGPHYRGGVQADAKYDADNLYETKDFEVYYHVQPSILLSGSEGAGGEATQDRMPSEEMLRAVDGVIDAHKDENFSHYYISDEPDCRNISEVYMRNLYEYIAQKDPYHVILTATRSPGRYVNIADWLESHPYLNPYSNKDGVRTLGREINTMGKYIDEIVTLDRPDKCIGFLPTCFCEKYITLSSVYPNFEEIVCHTWAAMMRGGKSLWPYAYHDVHDRAELYEGFRYVFSSFEALEDIVLFGKRTTLYRTPEAEAVLYVHGEEKMFVLVNMKPYEQTVTVDGINGTWHSFRHNETVTGNTFCLKPYEVVVGTNTVKDAGYPTYQQVRKLIDEQEYLRTHRGSLLFGCETDVKITTSPSNHVYSYKMFDGVRDNQAVIFLAGEKFYEVEMTQIKPTFTKVIIYGNNVSDAKLFVRNGGELSAPDIAETKLEQFSKTFILKGAITPEALRLEFFTDPAELYELEIFP